MTPGFAENEFADGYVADPILSAQRAVCGTTSSVSAYVANIALRQLGRMTGSAFYGMAAFAGCLAALGHAVAMVLQIGSQEQMIGIHAGAISDIARRAVYVTRVKYMHSFGDRPAVQLPRDTMCQPGIALNRNRGVAVAHAVATPQPAAVRHLAHKQLEAWFDRLDLSAALATVHGRETTYPFYPNRSN
jgi:hypothetical protein